MYKQGHWKTTWLSCCKCCIFCILRTYKYWLATRRNPCRYLRSITHFTASHHYGRFTRYWLALYFFHMTTPFSVLCRKTIVRKIISIKHPDIHYHKQSPTSQMHSAQLLFTATTFLSLASVHSSTIKIQTFQQQH